MKILVFLLAALGSTAWVASGDQDFTKEELLGDINPATHPDFTRIGKNYTVKSDIYMRSSAYAAFEAMARNAKADGVDLQIISATRPFSHQKSIWNRKWARVRYAHLKDKEKALDILLYSSMPGTSRHHWGTDIDLNALENDYFKSGKGKKIYDWLQDCGPEYGFHQTYTDKANGRTGYEEERWHYSYMPLSSQMLKAYENQITYDDIKGFEGAKLAREIEMIEKYVKGIDAGLLD